MWSPPAIAPALKPDFGPRYVDQNTDRNPSSPLNPFVLAVQTNQPDFDFAAVDVVSNRRSLRKLSHRLAGCKIQGFRVKVRNTVVAIQCCPITTASTTKLSVSSILFLSRSKTLQ